MKIEDIIGKNIVVHCDTIEKARKFLNSCYSKGIGSFKKDHSSLYNFSSYTCYRIPDERDVIFWCHSNVYEDDYEIIEFDDLNLEENDMDKITDLKEKITEFNSAFDKLINQCEDLQKAIEATANKNSVRVNKGEKYYVLRELNGEFGIGMETNTASCTDLNYFKNNNYFAKHERATEVLNKIKFLLRLERLHDELCPDYVPDWNNFSKNKYCVRYDYEDKQLHACYCSYRCNLVDVYFPSNEIAQKVCDILNSEKDMKDSDE